MKYLFFLIPLFLLHACTNRDILDCPYDFKYGGYCFKVPISISPLQMSYYVGDTIHISTIFSDSIEDISSEMVFKIQGFPFKPTTLLYRFYDEGNWESGYRVNEIIIDSAYQHVYNYSSNYADGFRAYTIYENGIYRFEFDLVLKEPGRYIFLMSDLYESYNATGNSELNAEADAITFEGDCGWPRIICSVIEGDNHLDFFEPELLILDEEVYEGGLVSAENPIGPLKAGGIAIEFEGFFGFEVLE